MATDRSDEFKFRLEGMQYVPEGYQIPCLKMLFGEDVVETQLAAIEAQHAASDSRGGSRGLGRGAALGGRPGGRQTAMPRFDMAALSGSSTGPPSVMSYASESTAVEETPEERARRQAKNQKKKAQKRRKAAQKAGQARDAPVREGED